MLGMIAKSPHTQADEAFLGFMQSGEGQDAFAKYGFVKAKGDELKLKPNNGRRLYLFVQAAS